MRFTSRRRPAGAGLAGLLLAALLAACGGSGTPPLTDIYKSDGSTQCESDGVTVAEMQRELVNAGIDVICGRKADDGRAYCAACGCPTGRINVYTIHAQNLADAEDLGFAPVSALENYRDTPCGP